MVKVDLVTGFLGAGKSTFLKGYAKYLLSTGEKVCILENDYGAINVDTLLFTEINDPNFGVEMVAGGCDPDCYKRRFKTKMITMAMLGYTYVIVEPSGIFDVDVFYDLLNEDELYQRYEIRNVFTIVDASLPFSLSEEAEYLLASQIATSGKVILSKTQFVQKNQITLLNDYINDALKKIHCHRILDITKDIYTKEWSLFNVEDYQNLNHSGYHLCSFIKKDLKEKDVFNSLFFMELQLNKDQLLENLQKLWNDPNVGKILRVKGFVKEDKKWYVINSTQSQTDVTPIENGQDLFIVIGEDLNTEKIDKYFPSIHSSFSTLEQIRNLNK